MVSPVMIYYLLKWKIIRIQMKKFTLPGSDVQHDGYSHVFPSLDLREKLMVRDRIKGLKESFYIVVKDVERLVHFFSTSTFISYYWFFKMLQNGNMLDRINTFHNLDFTHDQIDSFFLSLSAENPYWIDVDGNYKSLILPLLTNLTSVTLPYHENFRTFEKDIFFSSSGYLSYRSNIYGCESLEFSLW